MSHGDQLSQLPPDFHMVAHTSTSPFSAIENPLKKIYGIQFVSHRIIILLAVDVIYSHILLYYSTLKSPILHAAVNSSPILCLKFAVRKSLGQWNHLWIKKWRESRRLLDQLLKLLVLFRVVWIVQLLLA